MAVSTVRAIGSPNSGFRASSSAPPAPAQLRYWETHSTPPERNTSPSPALIAWYAIRVVWTLDAQNRLIVAPGSWSYPASTATTRARLAPWRPDGSAQPQ